MINCEYCNYYREINSKENSGALCTFTDVMLITDFSKSDKEYPCNNVTYQEYLNKEKNRTSSLIPTSEDWKYTYRCKHPVQERSRSKKAV